MNWIIDNWKIVISLFVVAAVFVSLIVGFFKLPSDKQKEKIKEWLIWACIEAEKELQSGTGQLKLRNVWDMFCKIPAFSFVAKIITFETFSEWVSDALEAAKKMLITNYALAEYVYGGAADLEIEKLMKQLNIQEGE